MEVFELLFLYSLGLTLFFLPFGVFPSNIFVVISMILGVAQIVKTGMCNFWQWTLVLPIMVVFMTVTLIYSQDKAQGIKLLERSLSMFLLPIIISGMKINFNKHVRLFYFLIAGLITTFAVSVTNSVMRSISIVNGDWFFNSSVDKSFAFYDSILRGGNYFFGGDFSQYFAHPTYISLFATIGIIFLMNKKGKLSYILISTLIIYIFLLSSRSAVFTLIVISVFYMIKFKVRKVKLIGLMGMLLIAIYILNPRTKVLYERLIDFTSKKNYNYTTSEQSRLLAWNASISLILDQPFFGFGIGDANDVLKEQYRTSEYNYNYNNDYNAHNQYLQTGLQMGFVGILLLISPLLYAFIKYNNPHIQAVILCFIIAFLFESMLSRFYGVLFYTVVMSIILNDKSATFTFEENSKES